MTRCPTCGCIRHSLFAYVRGWICWQIVRLWPGVYRLPPFLPTAGDYIFDQRGCGPSNLERAG